MDLGSFSLLALGPLIRWFEALEGFEIVVCLFIAVH
jgi:hypothetical protein